ncbi:MAG TPA: hypothetical protein VH591_18665 [Ktedonobacterales bacterium]
MMQDFAGMKLRCKDGHWEMADFELRNIPGAAGFEMWVACEAGGHNGGHWLARDSADSERVVVVSIPYQWPSAVDAFAARDRFAEQQGK